MHPTVRVIPLVAFVLLTAGIVPAFAAPPTDACSLLTTAQVSSTLGSTVGQGTYVMPNFKTTCTWTIPTGGAVTLQILTMQFFNAGKGALASAERTTASGVGDEAYYLVLGALSVRKGTGAFKIAVYSSALTMDKRKAVEKALAQQVLSKF
ncbi:MAG TPA: hypothetical protein VMV57_05950 [Terracidiphilus sp.]|nr:hypothetical protein [Terracidiphilus sp.]